MVSPSTALDNTSQSSTLTDKRTGIMYDLGSDKKRVTAKDREGRVLWKANPYIEAKLPFYRVANPSITYFAFVTDEWWKSHQKLGKAEDFISINFSSSQFGVLNKHDGKFIYLGQD